MYWRSIWFKLFFLLLVVGTLFASVTVYWGFINSRIALEKEVLNHLISIRDIKKKQIERYFIERLNDIIVKTTDPELVKHMEEIEELISRETAESIVDQTHQKFESNFHKEFDLVSKTLNYYDIYIVDARGNVVHSLAKEDDLGTNLIHGKYKDTAFGKVFRKGLKGFAISDIEYYEPSANKISAFFAAPIKNETGKIIAVLAAQTTLGEINDIMQERSGLGETGETFLIGHDLFLRSDSRFFKEKTVLKRKIDREAPKRAIAGKTGTMWLLDYRDMPVLNAYAPVNIQGLNWGIIAKMDEAEALAPIINLRQQTLFGVAPIILILLIVSYVVSRNITDSLRNLDNKLLDMASSGRYGDTLPIPSKDEIGSLVASFNKMSSTLKTQTDNLKESHTKLEVRVKERTVELEQEITERKRAEETIRSIIEGTSHAVGEEYFRTLSKHLAHALKVRIAFIAETVEGKTGCARITSIWDENDWGNNFEYEIKGTPCENVLGKELCFYPDKVAEQFPDDIWLRENGIKSYMAIPLFNSKGKPLGHMGVMGSEPMSENEAHVPILKIFSARATSEMERKISDDNIKNHTSKMENALLRAEEVLNLLSKPPSLVPFFVCSSMYRFARATGGGDTVRWVDFNSQYAGLYLHDVSGHDIQEILLNILATSIIDNIKTEPDRNAGSLPSVFFANMNENLLGFCDKTGHYITAVYALMDFDSREIKLSLAGHPKPWLVDSDGTVKEIGQAGFFMGQFDIKRGSDEEYKDTLLKLNRGQLLLLYSDGLVEQQDSHGIAFEDKLKENILPQFQGLDPEDAYDLLKKEFDVHLDGKSPDDDVSFVFLGSRPADKYEAFEFIPGPQIMRSIKGRRDECCPSTVSEKTESKQDAGGYAGNLNNEIINDLPKAYESIIEKLSASGWPREKIDKVRIVMNEIILNAIIHGNLCSSQDTVKISHVLYRDVLEVCVADKGRGFKDSSLKQNVEKEDLFKNSGRGMQMTSTFADKMYFNEDGSKIWVLFNNGSV